MVAIASTARLHERHGSVVVQIGDGPAQSITPELAEKLGKEMIAAAKQVSGWHHYQTTEIEA